MIGDSLRSSVRDSVINSYKNHYNLQSICDTLKIIESNNDANAIGDSGKAYGILQIHDICVQDVNRIYGTTYTHQDAFDVVCSEEIFYHYIGYGIQLYIKKHNMMPTEQDIEII